jgi:hypothetical protein
MNDLLLSQGEENEGTSRWISIIVRHEPVSGYNLQLRFLALVLFPHFLRLGKEEGRSWPVASGSGTQGAALDAQIPRQRFRTGAMEDCGHEERCGVFWSLAF